jgi:hypothetical protein
MHINPKSKFLAVEEEKIILELSLLQAKTLGAIIGGLTRSDIINFVKKDDGGSFRFDVSEDNYAESIHFEIYNVLKKIDKLVIRY